MSCFEWAQNLMGFSWTEKEVNRKLRDTMVMACREIRELSRKEKCDLRLAAYILAVKRVAAAARIRGLYP